MTDGNTKDYAATLVAVSKLDYADLVKMRGEMDGLVEGAKKLAVDEARNALEKLAAQHGFSLDEITAGKKKKTSGNLNPIRYRDPENPANEWTGRGRHPVWVKEFVERGNDLDSIEVPGFSG